MSPTLIVGTGRCGSTLLSSMVRAHPTVLSASELFSFVTDLGTRIEHAFPAHPIDGGEFWDRLATPGPRQALLLDHGLQMDEVLYPWERGRFTPTTLPPILQALLPHLAPEDPDALFDALGPAMRALPRAAVSSHYASLFGWLQARFGKRTWAERTGGSLRIVRRLRAAFPDAKVLHLVRDGRDTSISMSRHIGFRMALIAGQLTELLGVDPFESDDRSEEGDLTDDLAALLPERFDRAAFEAFDLPPALCGHYWSGEIATGLAALADLPEERLLTLRYEDLLERPDETVRRIGHFLDPDVHDEAWVRWSAARVGRARSSWRALPKRERDDLASACGPGFQALAAWGLAWAEA